MGTTEYMAPEMCQELKKERQYDMSVDIWQIGILTFEFLYGYPPFNAFEKDKKKFSMEDEKKIIKHKICSKVLHFPKKKGYIYGKYSNRGVT